MTNTPTPEEIEWNVFNERIMSSGSIAYMAGYDAYDSRYAKIKNHNFSNPPIPYERDTEEYFMWTMGWNECRNAIIEQEELSE